MVLYPRGVLLFVVAMAAGACAARPTVPEALADPELHTLIESLSEPPGRFDLSDNLVSNEPQLAENARWVREAAGGVYIGVGPEQNYTYIARLRPSIAFIVDIRRENGLLHLLYKALFELSSNRVEFVSLLFSRPRPDGLDAATTVAALFDRYELASPSAEQFSRTLARVQTHLADARGFTLTEDDRHVLARMLGAFAAAGPAIHFWGDRQVDRQTRHPSYRALMTGTDGAGRARSFLASEDAFQFVKRLHARNLIVPVTGDFAGPTTLRGIGEYARAHDARITAFYASNVGVYLSTHQQQVFCRNTAALPVATGARFIENDRIRSLESFVKGCR